MKIYTYYRRGIKKWRSEYPKDGKLVHLALGDTKEECEKKAKERIKILRIYIDLNKVMRDWR